MKKLIEDFSKHLEQALKTIDAEKLRKPQQPIANVLITGLGGSGIGGTIVAEMCSPIAAVPIMVNKDYKIPAFVNSSTLVIACSYSGNTEETLSAVKHSLENKATVVCVTSGGRLLDIARELDLDHLTMEGGNPPRSMFAYSFSYLTYILQSYGIAALNVQENLKATISLLYTESENIRALSYDLAKKISETIPVLYAINGSVGIAARWRQQLNENAKMLAWEAEIPEMNHNELVGWEGGDSRFSAIFLRSNTDYERNQKRIDIIKDIIGGKTEHIFEIWSKGQDPIQKTLYLVHLGDWLSYYLSEIRKVDIMDIKSIDLLKSELSKIPM